MIWFQKRLFRSLWIRWSWNNSKLTFEFYRLSW
jgi:hypothetical protein